MMAGPGVTNRDTTLTKLFVGGLPYHTSDKTLRAHFEQFGEIEEAVVITDRVTNKSKGYGFVTLFDPKDATSAIQDPNPVIDGRKANVNLAYLGAKPRTSTTTTATSVNPPTFMKPGLIAPQIGLQQFYMPGVLPGGIPIQQFPMLQPAQISPTAGGQYSGLAEYAAAYGYPGLGAGIDFSQAPAVTAAYGMPPQACFYSIPPTTPQLGMHYQPIPAEARLQ